MWYTTKHTKRNKPHFSVWIMRIAATIGCLTLISAYLLSSVYARFSTSVSGSDSARVAKWDVQLKTDENQGDMKFDGTTYKDDVQKLTYDFSVISNSEVSVGYDITVVFAAPIPANISVQIDEQLVQTGDGSKTTFDFAGGIFDLTETEKNHQLKITVVYMNGEDVIKPDFSTSVKIIVHAEQMD